jgi:hypothetical protein
LPLNVRPLVRGYFFLPAGFLTCLTVLVLDFVCLDFVGLLAMMLLVFYVLTPLRHIRFSAEEPSMAAGTAAVNHRGEVICASTDWCNRC